MSCLFIIRPFVKRIGRQKHLHLQMTCKLKLSDQIKNSRFIEKIKMKAVWPAHIISGKCCKSKADHPTKSVNRPISISGSINKNTAKLYGDALVQTTVPSWLIRMSLLIDLVCNEWIKSIISMYVCTNFYIQCSKISL